MEFIILALAWVVLGASGCIVLTRRHRDILLSDLFESALLGAFIGPAAWLAVGIDSIQFSNRIIMRKKGS